MNGLSVIIPSRNDANLDACVAAVKARNPLDIIVIDDGLQRRYPLCTVPGIQPFVYARNINLGIHRAGNDDVILLNDDALLETSGGFRALQAQHYAHPEFGLIAAATDVTGAIGQFKRPGSALRECRPMVTFSCVFIPRSTIQRVGLLDERFGVNAGGVGPRGYGCEDDDYCWRVRQAGLKLGVYDGCFVNHSTLPSTFRADKAHPVDLQSHERLFAEKHGIGPRGLPRPVIVPSYPVCVRDITDLFQLRWSIVDLQEAGVPLASITVVDAGSPDAGWGAYVAELAGAGVSIIRVGR